MVPYETVNCQVIAGLQERSRGFRGSGEDGSSAREMNQGPRLRLNALGLLAMPHECRRRKGLARLQREGDRERDNMYVL
jgi:hypothetical protein